jgi:hypothetical protein
MRTVETRIRVAAKPEAALGAFLHVNAMREWWHVERGLVEPREGGVWAIAWECSEHGFKYVITGRLASVDLARRLVISEMLYFNPDRPVLGPMTLTVEAVPVENGCELAIRQEGYRDGSDWDWYYKAVSWAWPEVAKDIKQFLETPSSLHG